MANATKPKIRLPYDYEPRAYQIPFWRAMDNGAKRAVLIRHRRAGKDKDCWNYTIREAYKRAGGYYYMLPKYTQARKIIWEGIDANTGMKFIDHIPKALLKKKPNDTEMKITMHTHDGKESIIQLVGSDRYNDLVGTPPAGIVMSEWSISNPSAWEFFRPILVQNGGWGIFNYTPRGKNHGYDTYIMAKDLMESGDPDWFCELLTVTDTNAVSLQEILKEQRAGMSEEMIQQEFYCSFEGAIHGAYYSKLISEARQQGRITSIPINTDLLVDTYWDLGMNDSTVIWFCQEHRGEYRMVDYYENNNEGLAHYKRILDEWREKYHISYGTHMGPHDIEVRELGTGASRKETAANMGLYFETAPKIGLMDGIDKCRQILPNVWFDKDRCSHGLKCLENYSKEYDEIHRTFKQKPLHDWTSHGADAFRTFAVTAASVEAVRTLQSDPNYGDEVYEYEYEY